MTGLYAALAALATEWRSSSTSHPACAHDEDCVGCAADELDALLAEHPADPKPITMHTGSHNPESSDSTTAEIEDGFGGYWTTCGPGCDLQVVRPGKVQCNRTSSTCPDAPAPEPTDRAVSDG